jgi:TonB family protein
MRRVALVLAILFGGCATTERSQTPPLTPELISMTRLPILPQSFIRPGQEVRRLNVLFCVAGDGTVEDIRVLSSSGDSTWDNAAEDSMKHWRFAPLDESGSHLWVRRDLIVKAQDPVVMSIGELVAGSKDEADSLYALLLHGASFDKLAHPPSTVPSIEQWQPGLVDIACYPCQIREELLKLGVNDITAPIRLGTHYVIYKRFESSVRSALQ